MGLLDDLTERYLIKKDEFGLPIDAIDRKDVAKAPETEVSVLKRLAFDESGIVREAVAGNLNTPGFILEHLAMDFNGAVSNAARNNPNLPLSFLEEQVYFSSGQAASFGDNPSFPLPLMKKVFSYWCKNRDYRFGNNVERLACCFSRQYKADSELLIKLYKFWEEKDSYDYRKLREETLLNIYFHPHTPTWVKDDFFSNPLCLGKDGHLLYNRFDKFANKIAESPKTSGEALEKLSKHSDEYIRFLVAGNANTPKEVLEDLTKDDYPPTRRRAKIALLKLRNR